MLRDAIVDSGASYTYVTRHVKLANERPSNGVVAVANGQLERITSVGTLGPLQGVRKVNSFQRTLVSVRDLVEQFGSVRFDDQGVHLVTDSGKSTRIGATLPNRLYSFDLDALARHVGGFGSSAQAA